jgi:hypothetical protein
MDHAALSKLAEDLKTMGWPWEELLDHAEAAPQWWAELQPGEAFRRLRWTRRLKQWQVASNAGIGQSHVARIEKGADCLVSTLGKLYAALGYTMIITAKLDGTTPRVDPRKEKSPWTEYLEKRGLR